MPSYKITYFKAKGRAEVCRQLFALADQRYEDVRLEREEWLKIKAATPFGQLPLLTIDGTTQIAQGNAMARLLAKRFNYYGETDIDQAKVDMILDAIDDMMKPMFVFLFQTPDETKKAELKAKFYSETLPEYNRHFEKLVTGSGFLVGDSLTMADLAFAHAAGSIPENNLDAFAKLKAVKTKVETTPAIAAWIAKRPETQF